jgi:hypothetical protein
MSILRSVRAAGLAAATALGAFAPTLAGCMIVDDDVVVSAPATPVSFDVFYGELSEYGEWITLPGRGWAWRPKDSEVGPGFVPYSTGGRWVYTDLGWSFETDWDWGWAAFHYGRWVRDPIWGWLWVPGYEWAPSWVEWRMGGGYIGWVPLGPPGVAVVETSWIFVEERFFTRPGVAAYAVPGASVHVAYAATTPIAGHAGVAWHPGPAPEHVARVTGTPVRAVSAARFRARRGLPRPSVTRPVRRW